MHQHIGIVIFECVSMSTIAQSTNVITSSLKEPLELMLAHSLIK